MEQGGASKEQGGARTVDDHELARDKGAVGHVQPPRAALQSGVPGRRAAARFSPRARMPEPCVAAAPACKRALSQDRGCARRACPVPSHAVPARRCHNTQRAGPGRTAAPGLPRRSARGAASRARAGAWGWLGGRGAHRRSTFSQVPSNQDDGCAPPDDSGVAYVTATRSPSLNGCTANRKKPARAPRAGQQPAVAAPYIYPHTLC